MTDMNDLRDQLENVHDVLGMILDQDALGYKLKDYHFDLKIAAAELVEIANTLSEQYEKV